MIIAAYTFKGRPPVKRRHRIGIVGGRARAFSDSRTVAEEEDLRQCSRRHAPREPHAGPIRLCLAVLLPIPRSWSKRKVEEAATGSLFPCGRPDLDNYIKAVLDALNGLMWRDDSQVVTIEARKRYVFAHEAGLLISVRTEEASDDS